MTIYTDPVTGKQYDRMLGGVSAEVGRIAGYVPCRECAFSDAGKHGAECYRAVEHCVITAPGKAVYFYFKERAV